MQTLEDATKRSQDEPLTNEGFFAIKPRLAVLLAAMFIAGSGLAVFEVNSVFIALILCLLPITGLTGSDKKLVLLMITALSSGVLNAQLRIPQPSQNDICRFCKNRLVIKASVLEANLSSSGKIINCIMSCHSVAYAERPDDELPVEGKIGVSVFLNHNTSTKTIAIGDDVKLTARPVAFANGSAKYRFRRNQLKRRNVFCHANVNSNMVTAVSHQETNLKQTWTDNWRRAIVSFHKSNLGEANGALLTSMVLGDKAVDLDVTTKNNFRWAGLAHVLAASGFNLSIVAASIYFTLRLAISNVWLSNSFCFAGMLIFTAVAGPSPSVVRALLMGFLLLLSRCLARSIHMPAALFSTMALVLLFDPQLIADVGFQFSYFSTAGLIFAANEFTKFLSQKKWHIPSWINAALAATIVAQACVLPLQLYYFQQVNPYCLPANLLVAPLVPPITILGFSSSFCFVLESAMHFNHLFSQALDKLVLIPVQLVSSLVSFIAALPYAQMKTSNCKIETLALYYLVLLAFPYMNVRNLRQVWLMLWLAAVFLLLFFCRN